METHKRICIEDLRIESEIGQVFEIKKGEEYITSAIENGKVTVFKNYWVKVPMKHFEEGYMFTQPEKKCDKCGNRI